MRHAKLVHRALQRLYDLSRCDAVMWHDIVKRERAHVGPERHRAAGVDDLDAEPAGCVERPRHVIAHRGGALARVQQAEQKVVITENGQRRLVDDRNVGEFEMRMQRVVRCNRGLDDRGEAHTRVQAPGRKRRPPGARERCGFGPRLRRAMILRHQQARRIHIGAGDVRVNIDTARHHDFARNVIGCVGPDTVQRRVDDATVADPNVAYSVAAIRWIDDPSSGQAHQHDQVPARNVVAIWTRTCATETAWLGFAAALKASPPIAAEYSIASWSAPGRPTPIVTRAGRRMGASTDVSAMTGTAALHSGTAAP